MGLFSTLGTGTSGLKASEIGISTAGHNISNANNEHYTRQRVVYEAREPFHGMPGDIGTGVNTATVVRIHDEFVFSRMKDSSNNLAYDSFSKKSLEEVAKYFPDLDGVGLATDLQNYYSSWNDLASNTDDGAQKIALVQNASTLSTNLSQTRDNVRSLQDSINDQLKTNVDEMNRIGEQIAELNKSISRVEVIEPNRANDLRDKRDKLEKTLTDLVDVSVFKGNMKTENVVDANLTDQGTQYHLNIAGHSFVDAMTFHPLKITNSGNESNYYSIYSESQDGSPIELTGKLSGGKVGAMLDLRGRNIDPTQESGFPKDGLLQGYVDDMDAFARTFVEQTNNIYAGSAQESMISLANKDLKDDTALVDNKKSIQQGEFDVVMYDNQGEEVGRKTIAINSLTTMNDGTEDSIVGQFNKNTDTNDDNNASNDIDDFFQAIYSYDTKSGTGTLSFDNTDKSKGYTIAVEDKGDTNFAGAVGLSAFLEGDDAASMGVKREYEEDPALLNGYGAPIEGNNDIANAMAQMQYDKFTFHREQKEPMQETMEGFYRFITTNISTDGENANRMHETSSALFNTINAEFQSISGVNIDEELTDLMKFQTAYGANAKVITTIDQMLDTLLGLKR